MQTAVEQSTWLSALCHQAGPAVPQQQWAQQEQYQHPATGGPVAADLMSTSFDVNATLAAPHASAALHTGDVQASCAVPANQDSIGMSGHSMLGHLPRQPMPGQPMPGHLPGHPPGQPTPGHPPGQQRIPRHGSLVDLLQEILDDEDTDGLLMDTTRATAAPGAPRQQRPTLQQQQVQLQQLQQDRAWTPGIHQQAVLQQLQQHSPLNEAGVKQPLLQQSTLKPPGHEYSQQLQQRYHLVPQQGRLLDRRMVTTAAGGTRQNAAGGVAAVGWTGGQESALDVADRNFLEMLRDNRSNTTDPTTWLENISRMCSQPGLPQDAWQRQQPGQRQQQQDVKIWQQQQQQLKIEQSGVSPEGPGSGHVNNAGIGAGCFYGNGGPTAAGNNAAAGCGGDGGNEHWFSDAWSHAITGAGSALSPEFSCAGTRTFSETPAAARMAAMTTAASATAAGLTACSPGPLRAAGVYQGCSRALAPTSAAAAAGIAAAGFGTTGPKQCNTLDQLQIFSEATEGGSTAVPISVGGCAQRMSVCRGLFGVATQQSYNALGVPTGNDVQQQQHRSYNAPGVPTATNMHLTQQQQQEQQRSYNAPAVLTANNVEQQQQQEPQSYNALGVSTANNAHLPQQQQQEQQSYNALGVQTANNVHLPQQQQQQQVGWYTELMSMDMADASSSQSPGQGSKCSASRDQRVAESDMEAEQSAACGSPTGRRVSVRVQQKRQQAATKAQQQRQQQQGRNEAATYKLQQQRRSSRVGGADSGGVAQQQQQQQQQQMFGNDATASGIGSLGLSALELSQSQQQQQQQQQEAPVLTGGDLVSPMSSQAFANFPISSQNPYQNTLESGIQQQQQQQSAAVDGFGLPGTALQSVDAIPKEQVQMMLANLQPEALQQLLELQQTQPVLARVVMKRVLQQLQQQQQQCSQHGASTHGSGFDKCQNGADALAAQINTGQHLFVRNTSSTGNRKLSGNGEFSDAAVSFSAGGNDEPRPRPMVFSRHRATRSFLPPDSKMMMGLNSSRNGRASSEIGQGLDPQQQQQQAAMLAAAAGGLEGMQGARGSFADVDIAAAAARISNAPRDGSPGSGSDPAAAAAAASSVFDSGGSGGSESGASGGANMVTNGDHIAHDEPPKSRKEQQALPNSKRLCQSTQNDLSDALFMAAAAVVGTEACPDTATLGLEQQQQAAADHAMTAAAAAGQEMSMGTSAMGASCSATTLDACDPAVIMQQARALLRILTKLSITQLIQARSMLSSVLERSARGLVNHLPAIERIVNQLIDIQVQSGEGGCGEIHSAESGVKQRPVSAAATPPPRILDAAASPSILAQMKQLPPQGYSASAAAASQGVGLMGKQQQQQQESMGSAFMQQQYQQPQQQMQHIQSCRDSQMQQHVLQMQQQQQDDNADPEQTPYEVATRWQSGRRIKRRSVDLPAQESAAAAAAGLLERAGSAPGPVGSSCSSVQQQQQQSLQSNVYYQQHTASVTRQQQQQLALQMIQQQQQQFVDLQQSLLGSNPAAAVAADQGLHDMPAASATGVTSSLGGIQQHHQQQQHHHHHWQQQHHQQHQQQQQQKQQQKQQQQREARPRASGWVQPIHSSNKRIYL